MTPARELANGRWHGLLGKWLNDLALAGKHTSCPMCGGKDRFRLDNKEGSGSWICSHCGAGDGFHLLQNINGWSFQEAAKYVEQQSGKIVLKPCAPMRSEEDIKDALGRVWNGASRVSADDPVGKYLMARCGLSGTFPACLRFHPALVYSHDDGTVTKHPAMLAQVQGADGKGVTIQRLWLTPEGKKALVPTPRKLMTPTRKLENAAVRLSPLTDAWLGVAEGLETALCAGKKHGMPVWAVLSAGLMKTFRPPEGVRTLFIFADNDRSFTGQAAAYELARTLTNVGVECKVLLPDDEGDDWADVYAKTITKGSTPA